MDVRIALDEVASKKMAADVEQELSGWLVIIGDDLYLLEQNLHEDYKQSMKIRITDRGIIHAVRQTILPLGGGESFVFHKANVSGFIRQIVSPEIVVKRLCVQERGHDEMFVIDISQEAIEAGKTRHEAALNFDFFKEMGDR